MRLDLLLLVGLGAFVATGNAAPAAAPSSPYSRWPHGPSSDSDFFPLGVWLQAPSNAARFKEAGINFYIGLWRGPTQEQLDALTQARMPVICAQNAVGLANRDNPIIIGWMHDDEPDNAQSLGEGQGYGPPIPPAKIVDDYNRWRNMDASRPVVLNLGQGVANDRWVGRGSWGKLEDYPQYIRGCDIVSYDIYPVADEQRAVQGNLWLVAKGVDRLHEWSEGNRIVWNVLETTRISNLHRKVTPHEFRAEVWMSLIHGSQGLIYFVHQFKPHFIEAGLLADPEMLEAVTHVNREIQSLARVLNSPTWPNRVMVTSSDPDVPVDAMLKESAGIVYLFAVGMRDKPTVGSFRISGLPETAHAEALGENRTFEVRNGAFHDAFAPYGVHLYKISR